MISQKQFLQRALPTVIQIASAHKKPRWLPVAKSKIYRIPKRPVVPLEEKIELARINKNYKTQMRAIRRFFVEEITQEKSSLASATSEISQIRDAEEWERCVALNDKWNAQIAQEREERLKIESQLREQHILKQMQDKDNEMRLKIEKATEEIRKQKALSSTFITPETLDAAIDFALDNPKDYNYAIDLSGNKFDGRETPAVLAKDNNNAVSVNN